MTITVRARSDVAYLEEFGLQENPFRISPSPRFTFFNNSTKEALWQLRQCIQGRLGLGVISGEVGSGKTTLSKIVAEEADSEMKCEVAYLQRIPGGVRQTENRFFSAIASDLDLPGQNSRSAEQTLKNIHESAKTTRAANRTTVVIIDDAHKLKPPTISAVLALLNLPTNDEFLVQILLFGQLPEMIDVIKMDRALDTRLAIHTRLNPMLLPDVKAMINHRLTMAGRPSDFPQLFTDGAIESLFRHAKGVPREICTIANVACNDTWNDLPDGIASREIRVDKRHVEAAAQKLVKSPSAALEALDE